MSLLAYSPLERSLLRSLCEDFDGGCRVEPVCPFWRNPATERMMRPAIGDVENSDEKFAVSLDVSNFKPEEVKINLSGHVLTLEGKHEEKDDKHGSIQRSFVRKYVLPEDVNLDAIRSSLTEQGKLTIEAPKKAEEQAEARVIPIARE